MIVSLLLPLSQKKRERRKKKAKSFVIDVGKLFMGELGVSLSSCSFLSHILLHFPLSLSLPLSICYLFILFVVYGVVEHDW